MGSKTVQGGIVLSALVVLVSGCASSEKTKEQEIVPEKTFAAPIEKQAFVSAHDDVYLGVRSIDRVAEPSWMDGKTVTLKVGEPISANEVIKSLRAQNINITTNLPVQGLSYSGYGVTDMPLEQALKLIFGSMGLDYINHEKDEYVTITPAKPETWYVDIGNRTVDFRSEGVNGAAGGDMGAQTTTQNNTGQAQPGEASFESSDDFWESIEEEIEARMKVIIDPLGLGQVQLVKMDDEDDVKEVDLTEVQSSNNGRQQQTGSENEVVLGTYAINPDTGAVTVRAPSFVLDELDQYFDRLDKVYNTQLKFEGQLLSVSQSEQSSKGIDLAAFATFADGYGFSVRNNALGGITVSPPEDGGTLNVAAENALGGAMVGLTSPAGALQLFNAFLESQGDVRTLQKPSVTTKSGIPGSFAKKETTYYNSVSQTTAGGDLGSGAVGVQNELVPVEMGVSMQIYPKFNPDKDNVSAQLNLSQIVLSDVLSQKQYLNTGGSAGGVETVEQEVPVLSDISYSGELILSNGDLVIVGGQMEYEQTNNGSGIMGRREAGLFKYLMGQDSESKRASTTYFAITVDIDRK